MFSAAHLRSYAILGALAAASWWVGEQLELREEPAVKPVRSQVDYYSKGIKRTVLTEAGKPKQILIAELMTHYHEDDRTEMDNPLITLYRDGKPPWVVQSETATASSNGTRILLNGRAVMARETADGGRIEILTRDVTYHPDRDYAETTADVIIRGPADETHAVGMQAYLEPALRFTLLQDVRRKHEMR